jgi:hypothetical protein
LSIDDPVIGSRWVSKAQWMEVMTSVSGALPPTVFSGRNPDWLRSFDNG